MTKYNLGQPLTRIDGIKITYGMLDLFQPPMDPKKEPRAYDEWRDSAVPLWRVAQRAVLEAKAFDAEGQEKTQTESEKFERYQLALKLSDADLVALTSSEVQAIKTHVATAFHTEVMGVIWLALENPIKEDA
jgi:hypothetical protein